MTQGTVLIVGAGHAGFQVAASLRQHGYGDRICLINDEAHLPYQRPPLSKAYLKGEGRPDSLMFLPDKFYRDQNIELIADRAVSIDRGARRLLLASGTSRDYGHLVLATGARNRLLDIPNANLANVRYLRILDESEALRKQIASGQRVVVIGAGFIGLEFAATARIKGLEVDVAELASRVMGRAVTAEISDYFQERHTAAGIRIHLGVQATSIESDGTNVTGVSLSDGRHIPAGLVVGGVRVLPNVELADQAALPTAARAPRTRQTRCRLAVFLERPGRRQASDRRADHRIRPGGGARRPRPAVVLGVLLQVRAAGRHRVGQP